MLFSAPLGDFLSALGGFSLRTLRLKISSAISALSAVKLFLVQARNIRSFCNRLDVFYGYSLRSTAIVDLPSHLHELPGER